MYWTPKMHKTAIGHRFIVASKKWSTKHISKAVSSIFKLIFHQIENFHKNEKFLKNYNKFWVIQNVDPIIDILQKINKRKRAKTIATYDFSTLYTNIPHDDLISKLSQLIDFVFEGGDKKYILISDKIPCFLKNAIKVAVKHLIQN